MTWCVIETLQRNALDSSQYLRREIIEINLVPEDIQDTQFEESLCQALSLTGTCVTTGDLEVCHKMRWRDWVIIKFSSRKKRNDFIFNKKSLNGKSDELKTWDLHQQNYSLVTWCVMGITNSSIDAGSWRDGTYYIQPGSSTTASI